MRTACPLIAGLAGKFSQHRHFLSPPQGQQTPFVFQQYSGLRGDPPCHKVVPIVIAGILHLPGLGFLGFGHQFQNAAHRLVQGGLAEAAAFQILADLGGTDAMGCGHFQVQPRLQAQAGIIHRTPIGDHRPLKPPFFPQDGLQEALVFAGVGAVHFVVSTHDGPGLGLPHRLFEGG